MKRIIQLVVMAFLIFSHVSFSQNQETNKVETQPQKILKTINFIVREYVFSIGVTKYDPFTLNGYILKQGQYTINLKKVLIYNGGRKITGIGLEFLCIDTREDCIKVIDQKTNEVAYVPYVVFLFNNEEIIIKLVTEFSRLKNCLNL